MRRKSARNANKSPEKALKEIETPPPTAVKTRRSRRRKHTPSSKSSDTEDDEITRKQNKCNTTVEETPDTTTKSHTPTDDDDDGNNGDGNNDETSSSQEPMWKVTTSSDEKHHGEIQKLKICLTRPSPDSPEKTKQQTPQRRSKSNSQTEDETTTSSEDKSSTTSTRRSTRTTTTRGSPFVDEGDEQKKGKGKSKGKHKTKIEQSPKLNEMNENQTMNIEISENVQVTQQSPTIDKPVDTVENDHDDVDVDNGESSSNVNENKADHVDDCDDKTKEKSIETAIPEEKIDKIDDNKNVTDDNDKKIDDDDDDDKPLSKIVEETIEKKDEESEKIIEQEQEKQENIQQEDKVEMKQDEQEDNVKDSEIQKETEKTTVEDSEVEKSTNVDNEIVDTSAECNKSEEPNKPEKVPEQETTEVMKTDDSTTTTTTSTVVSTKRKRLIRDRELVKEIETAQHKRQSKWCINLERLSTLIKIDLDAVQTISPTTIEFPEEPDLNIDTVVPESIKERRRSSQTIEKKYERKISIEQKGDNINEESQEKSEQNDNIDENKSNIIAYNRKISIVDDTASKLKPPPSPAKNPLSQVLFITNLVRPFTIKQLKELLERTGKIIEDGFWTDRIKSKCYVQYETVEEAETTRNALHGVQWPIGNGKKLIIDYATVEDLENAKNPPVPSTPTVTIPEPIASKENLEPVDADLKGDDRKTKDAEKRKSDGPIREWDIGKRDVRRDRSRSRDRNRKHRRSPTPVDDFISKKQKRLEEAAPQKLMDDLFLKTKATPSIYWQPLSPEEIATKQQQRLIRMEEHKRRLEESSRFRSRDGRGNFRRRYD